MKRDLFVQNAGLLTVIGERFGNKPDDRRFLMRSDFTKAERRRLDELIDKIRKPYVCEQGTCALNNACRPTNEDDAQELEYLIKKVEQRSGKKVWRYLPKNGVKAQEGKSKR